MSNHETKLGYVSYTDMKDFCTIAEVCEMFNMTVAELKFQSEKYKINPIKDDALGWGFPRYLLCSLHNLIYKAQVNKMAALQGDDDPWK